MTFEGSFCGGEKLAENAVTTAVTPSETSRIKIRKAPCRHENSNEQSEIYCSMTNIYAPLNEGR